MSTLFTPEFERYATRRVTVLATVSLVIMLGLCLSWSLVEGWADQGSVYSSGPFLIIAATLCVAAWGYFTAAASLGSEQTSGALGMWLTFHPRRLSLYLAKLMIVTVPTFLMGLVANALAVGVTLMVSSAPNPATFLDLLGIALRGALLATAAAMAGFGVTVLGRSLLSALGVLVGWLLLAIVQSFAEGLHRSTWDWVGLEVLAGNFLLNSDGGGGPSQFEISMAVVLANGLGLLLILSALLVVAGSVFVRRDVH